MKSIQDISTKLDAASKKVLHIDINDPKILKSKSIKGRPLATKIQNQESNNFDE